MSEYSIGGMAATRTLINEAFAISSRYRIVLLVLEVPISKKFPSGIKAKFVMIDSEGDFPRLLVDNHEPFGFHMHTQLPEDANVRVELSVKDHHEALDIFLREAERISENERR
jgi:hypothetical protein